MVLSGLSAGLWWSINWFVAELRASEAEEAEKKRLAGDGLGEGEDIGEETEGETVVGEEGVVGTKGVEAVERVGEVKDRRAVVGEGKKGNGGRSEASTEDEWERVSENENEKDK